MKMQGTPAHLHFKLHELINLLKSNKFNVRLSINMSKIYDTIQFSELFRRLIQLGVNQVTIRELYNSGLKRPEDIWVSNNKCKSTTIEFLKGKIQELGKFLYSLPYGPKVYSIYGMSTVLDDDCMSKNNNETLKYVILRENGKLYCQWDDEGSLIF